MTNQIPPPTLLTTNPRIQLNNQGEILSFELTAKYHILGRDPQQPFPEGLKVPPDWVVISRNQACLRKIDNDYWIYDGDGETASKNHLFINNKVIPAKEGYRLQNNDEVKIGQNPQNWVTLTFFDPKITQPTSTLKQRSVYLKNKKTILLGRSAEADLELDSPTISRRHATIETDEQGHYLLKDLSTNGIFVNREKVTGSTILAPGALLQIGPYSFVLQGDELVLVDRGENIRLDAKNLIKVVKDKHQQRLVLLNEICLAIEPGQFVALVGGSGAGKSTLMKSLLGIEPITSGMVYLNGDNLRTNFNIYRNLIGYVPQHDIVHTNLTVKEVLYYAARLRLPPDIDIENVVQKTLEQIELVERQNTLVKSLSGGQLKRVSIGVELLADPKLFFLDEPTSGLDPGLDKKMMQLLRKLADEGRTVILVTHATTNIKLCDRLVFLGLGGNLCYFGPPAEANEFFRINNVGDFADIYIQLETKNSVIEAADKYRQSEYQQKYIDSRLSQSTQETRFSPKQVKGSFFKQFLILIQRYLKLIVRDKVYLTLSLLTAPIGIALITLAVQENSPLFGSPDLTRASLARRILFVITCAGIWSGFASSLQEIVKESAIYLRERLVNLGLFSYLGSKVVTLGGLTALQSILIVIVMLLGFGSPERGLALREPDFLPWSLGIFITTFLTILTSVSLGLMVSASVKNSTQANSALPLLLLPQIIFAGVLFDMVGLGKYISWLMLSRWSVGAYGSLADVNILVPLPPTDSDGKIIPLSIQELAMFEPTIRNLLISWGALLIHTMVYLLITLWLQKRKDIFK